MFGLVPVKRGRELYFIYSYEALRDFRVPVSKLVEVVLRVEKGAKFRVEKRTVAKILYVAETPVSNWKNFEKQALFQND